MSDSQSIGKPDFSHVIRDPERLAALRHVQLLDTAVEEAFDRLTRLASKMIGAPVSLISLVDEGRQFFKSSIGLQEPWASQRETPLTHSFCQYAVATGAPLIISDARDHPLVHDNLAIADLEVVAYAGVPLITNTGQALGSFCVIDTQPRQWTGREIDILRDLAAMVMTEIDLRMAMREAELRAAEAEQQRVQKAAVLERLNRVVETNASGIVIVDAQGCITFVNSAAEHILGVPRDTLLGHSATEPAWKIMSINGEPFSQDCLPVAQVLRTGQPVSRVEIVLIRENGTRLILETNAAPLNDDSQGVVATFVDITGYTRAEAVQRVLVQAGSVLAATLDYDDMLSRVARLGVPEFADWCAMYTLDNERVTQASAVHADSTKEELVRSLQQRMPVALEDDHPVARVLRSGEPLLAANAQQEPITADEAVQRILQEVGFRSFICVPLVARGRMLGALMFVRAQANHQYTESDLQVAQELARRAALAVDNAWLYQEAQQAVQARDDLFSMVTHDLRNPLTTINGYADVLQRRIRRMELPDPSRLTEGLMRIREAGDKMAQQLNELLDTAVIRSGGMLDLQRDPLNIVTLVKSICAEQQQVAHHNTVRLQASDADLMGYFDARRIERVFTNLVANAVKYSASDKPIDVIVTRQQGPQGDWAVLSVQDRGIGIPAVDLPYIFERFRRGSNVGAIRGSGIGLATVASIVEQHGGSVAVESTEGEGTTFTVRLPLIPLSQIETTVQNTDL
jgi:PAS domain S-box-containing protein